MHCTTFLQVCLSQARTNTERSNFWIDTSSSNYLTFHRFFSILPFCQTDVDNFSIVTTPHNNIKNMSTVSNAAYAAHQLPACLFQAFYNLSLLNPATRSQVVTGDTWGL
jgi:hypothetical protein